jgi:DNA polymerase I-like protein with 3'-5' exonuclease and polymerase domains
MLHLVTSCVDAKLVHRVFSPVLNNAGVKTQTYLLEGAQQIPYEPNKDVFLFSGTKALEVVKTWGESITPKAKLGAQRGFIHDLNGRRGIFTFDPYLTVMDVSQIPEIQWDTRLAIRVHKSGSTKPMLGNYRYVEDFTDLRAGIEQQYEDTKQPVLVCVDTETVGKDEYALPKKGDSGELDHPGARFVSIQFSYKPGFSDVLYCLNGLSDKAREDLVWLCTSPIIKMTGANLKYDDRWFRKLLGFGITNQTFDTYLVGSLLDENRGNSLKDHTKTYTDIGGYEDDLDDKYSKDRMDLVPQADLLPYAGGDTDGCLQVTTAFRKELLEDKRLTNFYVNLLQPAAKVFTKLESRGVIVDESRYDKLAEECQEEIDKSSCEAFSHIPMRIQYKYSDNLKLSRAAILKEYLFTSRGLGITPTQFTESGEKLIKSRGKQGELTPEEKVEYAATSADYMKSFWSHPDAGPFAMAYAEWSLANRTLTNYIQGFRKHIRSDGRFHPSYIQGKGGDEEGGTLTGRLSCKDPAYQVITKRGKWAKKLRSVFVCPPGYAIMKLDYSQGELRIIADRGPEPTMLQAYLDNKDIHAITAAQVSGYKLEDFMKLPEDKIDDLRRSAKAINFGFVYGLQAPGFVDYAWSSYGVKTDLNTAIKYRSDFFALYNKLLTWHAAEIRFAQNNGYVRNQFGRLRHLPLINSKDWGVRSKQERQAINSCIQSTLSDAMQLAMVEIDRQYPDLWMFGNTHDSLEVYVPVDEIEIWAKRLKQIMENLPTQKFEWNPRLKLTVDVEYSLTNLAETSKLKIAA